MVLEITENVAMENYENVRKRIDPLIAMGFSISIDDFVTGYSAFVYLQHFSIQEIKIDRQFINRMSADPKSAVVIETIIHLGKMLGLKTIAEGVETIEQWGRLKDMGCTEIQGYYFSKPLPLVEINLMLERSVQSRKIYLPF